MSHDTKVIVGVVIVAVCLLVICLLFNCKWKRGKDDKNKDAGTKVNDKHDDGHISISTDQSSPHAKV
uniref:Uncharacterized protein n=1 Tax=Leersia perrieri TaxID=77586 RepID=A0A0D9V3S8_9ORYZ